MVMLLGLCARSLGEFFARGCHVLRFIGLCSKHRMLDGQIRVMCSHCECELQIKRGLHHVLRKQMDSSIIGLGVARASVDIPMC